MSTAVASRRRSLRAFWGGLAASTLAFLLPVDAGAPGSPLGIESLLGVPIDKAVHTLVFAGLLLLAWRARKARRPGPSGAEVLSSLLLIVAGLLGYAIAVEACQYALPWRSFETLDLLANGVGLGVGSLWVVGAECLRARRHPDP